jgi:hypothetical protein
MPRCISGGLPAGKPEKQKRGTPAGAERSRGATKATRRNKTTRRAAALETPTDTPRPESGRLPVPCATSGLAVPRRPATAPGCAGCSGASIELFTTRAAHLASPVVDSPRTPRGLRARADPTRVVRCALAPRRSERLARRGLGLWGRYSAPPSDPARFSGAFLLIHLPSIGRPTWRSVGGRERGAIVIHPHAQTAQGAGIRGRAMVDARSVSVHRSCGSGATPTAAPSTCPK